MGVCSQLQVMWIKEGPFSTSIRMRDAHVCAHGYLCVGDDLCTRVFVCGDFCVHTGICVWERLCACRCMYTCVLVHVEAKG